MKSLKKSDSFAIIGTFLVLELLAFAGFSLANSVVLYGACALVIASLLVIGTKIDFSSKGFSSLTMFVIPLFIYGLLLCISPFSSFFSPIENVFVPLAMVSFAAVGALCREQKEFKLSTALLAIYGSLAALVFISYFWNMVQFEPFYTITYSNYYHYYDGTRSPVAVGDIAYFLVGFSLEQVSIEYFSFFATLLSTSVIGLFFINPREDKQQFTLFAIFAAVGIIPLITMPTKITILFTIGAAVIIALVVLLIKVRSLVKIFKYVGIGVLSLGGLLFFILFLNAQTDIGALKPLRDLISGNALLNRLFNSNRFSSNYNLIISDYFKDIQTLFSGGSGQIKVLGFMFQEGGISSNSFFVDNFMMSGLFGTIVFVVFMVTGCISLLKLVNSDDIPSLHKAVLLAFVGVYIFYAMFGYDMDPYVYYSNYIPFYFSGPFMIILFFFGYSFKINNKVAQEVPYVVQQHIQENEVIEL